MLVGMLIQWIKGGKRSREGTRGLHNCRAKRYRRINVQTKLRTAAIVFAASLLSASMISAASQAKKLSSTAHPKSHFVGIASWYGLQHQGLKMANGKRFDRRKLTAASWYV